MLEPTYYLQRADEMDVMAGETHEPAIREGFVELARTYRTLAERAQNSPQSPDAEVEQRLERMVENVG